MATMTQGVHAIRYDDETMTEAIHRAKADGESMTEQQHDLAATVANGALPSGTFDAATASNQTDTSGTITWIAPSGGDPVTTYSVVRCSGFSTFVIILFFHSFCYISLIAFSKLSVKTLLNAPQSQIMNLK